MSNPHPPPSSGGGTFLGFLGGFLFSAAVSSSRHKMKKLCECGLYVADLEKALQMAQAPPIHHVTQTVTTLSRLLICDKFSEISENWSNAGVSCAALVAD